MERYRVELEELLAFVDRLQNFEQRAEAIASSADRQIADLHGTWSGAASESHQAHHQEWMAAATQMREALAELRGAASKAHTNYSDVIDINTSMWP